MKTKLLNLYISLIPILAFFLSGACFAIHQGENWFMALFFLTLGLLGLKLYTHVKTSIN